MKKGSSDIFTLLFYFGGIPQIWLCIKNVNISYINNEYDFTIEFSRIDRNEIGEINGEINGELSKEELVVLSVFKNNRKAIKEDIINETRYSSRTIDRIIRSLKDKELIKRIGSNKNGYWEVLK